MTENTERLLLCTNGSAVSLPGLRYGEALAEILRADVHLLGIAESARAQDSLRELVESASRRLESAGLRVEHRLVIGAAEEVIPAEAAAQLSLVVVGPLGRPTLHRWLHGSYFRRLMAAIRAPLLFVPVARLPLRKMLVCTGGLPYSATLEQLSIKLARAARATLTLLHVVEPISLDYPLARQVEENWQSLLTTATPQARDLLDAREQALQAGVEVDVKVRRGNPVHEILAEQRAGEYDLIGMGSAYSARSLRHLFLPNVTAGVAETASCPVLAVRAAEPSVDAPDAQRALDG